MDPDFWLQRWQANEIGFHQEAVQPALMKHWAATGARAGSRVLVPLCGKSLDMAWLAGQGLHVVGSELSELAIDAFYAGLGVTPDVRRAGEFTVKSHGPYELWIGDFFALTAQDAATEALYDRAALIAMPPNMQPRYAAKLAELQPPGAKGLVIGLDYDQREMQGPPFSVPEPQVRKLLAPAFDISVLDVKSGSPKGGDNLAKRGLSHLAEAAYLVQRKP